MNRLAWTLAWVLASLACVPHFAAQAAAQDTTSSAASNAAERKPAPQQIDYARQVKPLLRRHCYGCHGARRQESSLRLDTAALARKGGDRGPAIVPGKVDKSPLLGAISAADDDLVMPPEGERLTPGEIALIKAWVVQGAKAPDGEIAQSADGRDHWAFQPIVRQSPPAVNEAAWCSNPIDRFVLARLEQEGLRPSSSAERTTQMRRLYLYLLGLTPSVDEVDAYLADDTPGAYDRLVDRLLASPAYGERFGRHWLDAARYADSNGFTIDGPRSIWKYRDWVISAFNRDLGFDRFTIEQYAGDLLPDATQDQIIATGFHRNTLINQEGGTDQEQFRVESIVDRVNTTGAVFLGLTIGCCQCHDHKYDPLQQREYYQLYSLLNNCDEPNILVATPEQQEQLDELNKQLAAAEAARDDYAATRADARRAWEEQLAGLEPVTWQRLQPAEFSAENGSKLLARGEAILVDGVPPDNDVFTARVQIDTTGVTAIRLDAMRHFSLTSQGPGTGAGGNYMLTGFELTAGGKAAKWKTAWADYEQPGFPISAAIDGKSETGWGVTGGTGFSNVDRHAVFVLDSALDKSSELEFRLRHESKKHPRHHIGYFLFSITRASPATLAASDEIKKLAAKPLQERTKAEQQKLTKAFLAEDARFQELAKAVNVVKANAATLRGKIPTTMVLKRRSKPRETFVQIRGDFLRPGERVAAAVPSVLPQLSKDLKDPTRLDLAKWLIDPANPLTARVTVNRVWQRAFGTGIVQTENDFGTRGTPPTHPELLDWLASELVRGDWSLKRLQRLIVTSATFRQSSAARPDLAAIDPRNRFLARQRRIRMEAETIRDSALAASGLLSPKLGGPSVFPPQPKGLDMFTQNKKNWQASQGGDRYRRGLYTFFWRSSPDPFMTTFDAPDGNAACTRRPISNNPLQALTLANDEAFVELAQGLASRVYREASADHDARLVFAFRSCLSRHPGDDELDLLRQFFAGQRDDLARAPDEAKRLAPADLPQATDVVEAAAWTATARVLLNLDEFVTRE